MNGEARLGERFKEDVKSYSETGTTLDSKEKMDRLVGHAQRHPQFITPPSTP